MNHKIKMGAVASYFQIAVNLLFVMLFTPFLVKRLGSSDYAIYTLLYTFLSYFVMDFGIGSSLAKFITDCKYNHETEWNEQQLLGICFKIFIVLSLVLCIILGTAYNWLDSFFTGLTIEEIGRLKGAYIVAVVYVVIGFAATPIESIYTANECFAPLKIFKIFQKVLFAALACGAILLGKGLIEVIAANTISGLLTIVLETLFLKRKRIWDIEWDYWNLKMIKEMLGFSIWMAIVTFAQRFIIPIAPTILGRFSNSAEISLFSLASTLEGYVFTFAAALNGLFLPNVSRLVNQKKYTELDELQIKLSRIQTIIVSFIIGGFIVFGHEFLALWVGEQYQKVYYIFLLISLSDIFYLSQEIASNVLIVLNKIHYRAIVYVVSATVNVILSSFLATKSGAMGVAIGISICLWSFNIITMMVVCHKETPLAMNLLIKNCYLNILPLIGVYTTVWIFVNKFVPGNSWLVLIFKIIVYSAGLGTLLWMLVFTPAEKKNILIQFNRFSRRAKSESTDC